MLSNSAFLDIPVGTNTYKSENNAESVWEIQYNDEVGTNTYLPGWLTGGNRLFEFFSPLTNSYQNQVIDPSLWNEFESVSGHPGGYTKDPRAYATCYTDGDLMDWRSESGYNKGFLGNGINAKGPAYDKIYAGTAFNGTAIGLKKYYYPQFVTISSSHPTASPQAAPVNVRIIRYSDVLLMYAEASLQYNNDADGSGLAALNLVRARVDMPVISTLTPASILHERNVELATESLRYFDLLRWSYDLSFGIDLSKLFNNNPNFFVNFDKNKNYYFHIPQSEINANRGALKQNPGW